jgi:hypothetical protein
MPPPLSARLSEYPCRRRGDLLCEERPGFARRGLSAPRPWRCQELNLSFSTPRSPLSAHHSPLTTHHSPLATRQTRKPGSRIQDPGICHISHIHLPGGGLGWGVWQCRSHSEVANLLTGTASGSGSGSGSGGIRAIAEYGFPPSSCHHATPLGTSFTNPRSESD